MTPAVWIQLRLTPPPDAPDGVPAACLLEVGGRAVQEEGADLITYVEAPTDGVEERAAALAESLQVAVGAGATVSWSLHPHEDWLHLWRQGFRAHEFGGRLLVAAPWVAVDPPPEMAVVRIDPGVAFGTAEHGSTRGCLTLLERILEPGGSVLDVGAGSGVLALSALRLGAHTAVLVEIDETACEAARENADSNGLMARTKIHAAAFTPELRVQLEPPTHPLVLCNMVWERTEPLLGLLVDCADPGGRLILGGLQPEDWPRVAQALAARGWMSRDQVTDEGWVAAVAERQGA